MSVRTRTAARLLTVAALGLALCAGCTASGGEEPAPTKSSVATSAAATPEPSPSPTEVPPYDGTAAPQMPADMASDSHLGARAAATYFVEVRHWAVISGDSSGLVALCDAESSYCSSSIAAIAANVAAGATAEGGLPTFAISSVVPPTADRAFYEIVGTVDEEPLLVKDAQGQLVESTDGISTSFVVFAEFRPGQGWLILGADTQTS